MHCVLCFGTFVFLSLQGESVPAWAPMLAIYAVKIAGCVYADEPDGSRLQAVADGLCKSKCVEEAFFSNTCFYIHKRTMQIRLLFKKLLIFYEN